MSQFEESSARAADVENDSVTIGAAKAVTFHAGPGTDTGTDRYLNLPGGQTFGFEVIPTVACSITELSGKILKAGISVGTGGYSTNHLRVTSIKIQAGAATDVEVTMKE